MKNDNIKDAVKDRYGKVAKNASSCCQAKSLCGCGGSATQEIGKHIGYSESEMASVPENANLGLGCGNPVALASLKEGETVLDLGSGAGFDCFLAANKVGASGSVIGVDMTPEMIAKAKENAKKGGYKNVDFRLGEIESLPVDDNSIDIVISNCVINLSPDKEKVFKETYRVLKPGGRLMVSDIVWLSEVPDFIRESINAYVGCIGGAMLRDEYMGVIKKAGFGNAKIVSQAQYPVEALANDPVAAKVMESLKMPEEKIKELMRNVASIKVSAIKPVK